MEPPTFPAIRERAQAESTVSGEDFYSILMRNLLSYMNPRRTLPENLTKALETGRRVWIHGTGSIGELEVARIAAQQWIEKFETGSREDRAGRCVLSVLYPPDFQGKDVDEFASDTAEWFVAFYDPDTWN